MGLINNEISSQMGRGMLVRAQAIIAQNLRAYPKKEEGGRALSSCWVQISTRSIRAQPLEDRAARSAPLNDTTGMVLYYKGELALTLYHSNAGGRTESR